MEEQIIDTLKKFQQQDYKRGGVSIAPEMYNAIAKHINDHYKRMIIDICNEDYSSDEKIMDIARIFIPDYDPHEASEVKCDLCNKKWLAVRPLGINQLECPNCTNMVYFENVS